mgnify:CR=1 FL=1
MAAAGAARIGRTAAGKQQSSGALPVYARAAVPAAASRIPPTHPPPLRTLSIPPTSAPYALYASRLITP